VLWSRGAHRRLKIASVTKMMTALVVVAHVPRHGRVLITREALHYQGSGVGVLPLGRRIDVETMLYGLLLPSGNDAAIALAQRVAGRVSAFIRLMNAEARALGLHCTHFTSADGLRDAGNYSCPIDLAVIARAVLRQPRLAKIVRTWHASLPFPIRGGRLDLYNNNTLMRLRYPGTDGVKTGFTNQAGHCLVAVAHRGRRRLGVVLLHSPDTGSQARTLLDLGFRALRRAG
jgi:D-alanyl-D-alanine carboxypeptidase